MPGSPAGNPGEHQDGESATGSHGERQEPQGSPWGAPGSPEEPPAESSWGGAPGGKKHSEFQTQNTIHKHAVKKKVVRVKKYFPKDFVNFLT